MVGVAREVAWTFTTKNYGDQIISAPKHGPHFAGITTLTFTNTPSGREKMDTSVKSMKTQNTSEDEGNALGGPCEVPLIEQLRSVPETCREMIEINPTHHRNIPYGSLCHKAADEIERLSALAPSPTSQPNETQKSANAETPPASKPTHGLDSIANELAPRKLSVEITQSPWLAAGNDCTCWLPDATMALCPIHGKLQPPQPSVAPKELPSLREALTWLHARTRTLEQIYSEHDGTGASRLAGLALTMGPDGRTLCAMATEAHSSSSGPSAEQKREDTQAIDWLEKQYVVVREMARWGSRLLFEESPTEGDGEEGPSGIRAAIRKARSLTNDAASAAKEEKE